MKTRHLSLASALALGACFTPTGSGDGTAATDPTAATTGSTDTTVGPVTTPTTTTTTATGPTTGGPTTTGPVTDTDTDTDTDTTATSCPTGACQTCRIDDDCGPDLHCNAGTCVECLSDEHCDGAVCDLEHFECRGCEEHHECPETACEIDDRVCFPVETTVHAWVDPNIPCGEPDECSIGNPCCTVDQALDVHLAQAEHLVIHLAPGTHQTGFSVLEPGKRVAVLGGENVRLTAQALGAPLIQLGDGMATIDSELYVARLVIENGMADVGAGCANGGLLWLDDVDVIGLDGRPLSAVNCPVVVRRAEFRLNTDGVAVLGGAAVHLINSTVAYSGVNSTLAVKGNGWLDLLYTTVGDATQHTLGLIDCGDGTALVSARNSALVSGIGDNTLNCLASSLDIRDSVVSNSLLSEPDKNVHVLAPAAVPAMFVNWAGGNLHVVPGSALETRAVWQAGDPRGDIDGHPRPLDPGALDVAGADVPAP